MNTKKNKFALLIWLLITINNIVAQNMVCNCDTIGVILPNYSSSCPSRYALNIREKNSMEATKDFYYLTYFDCLGNSYLEEYTEDSILIAKGYLKPIFSEIIYNMKSHVSRFKEDTTYITQKYYIYNLEKTGDWYYYDRQGKFRKKITHVPRKFSQKQLMKRVRRYNKKIQKRAPAYCKKYPVEC